MVPILAKQAVQIKCGFESARMTGNYELAYALGILTAQAGMNPVSEYQSMKELKDTVMEQTSTFTTEDERLRKMIYYAKDYEPSDVFDDQMKELYEMGVKDKKL